MIKLQFNLAGLLSTYVKIEMFDSPQNQQIENLSYILIFQNYPA